MLNLGVIELTYPDLVLLSVLLVCCYTDLRTQKIYNKVIFPAIVVAIAANLYFQGLEGGLQSLKGLALGVALLFIPFAAGGIGAGDVKLLGAVGAFKGPEFVLIVFLAGAVAGGVISVVLLLKQGRLMATIKKVYYTCINKLLRIPVRYNFNNLEVAAKGDCFPYAVSICAGAICAYIMGWL